MRWYHKSCPSLIVPSTDLITPCPCIFGFFTPLSVSRFPNELAANVSNNMLRNASNMLRNRIISVLASC